MHFETGGVLVPNTDCRHEGWLRISLFHSAANIRKDARYRLRRWTVMKSSHRDEVVFCIS